ncbi:MAG: cobalamin-independent methionine synthase II family protein [Chloroflexi bacterium]|nr:MAG: cobalamin-independent methionine synthase II family protein [Chloroflexota bacterium]
MPHEPIVTTVVGSYPIPGWLQLSGTQLAAFGPTDLTELWDDAVTVAVADQLHAGLDVITDGEQTRTDFNLSFYAFLAGVELNSSPSRRFGPPGHDQRPMHRITGELRAPSGLRVVDEFKRLQRLAPKGRRLKASVPGPYTLAGRLKPNDRYRDRHAVTEALIPIVRTELTNLIAAGCEFVTVDEPSMSCYADREDRRWLVDAFNQTVEPVRGRCYLGTHLCFGNYKGRAAARRRYGVMFPDFLDLHVNELHVEMANREFAELELAADIAKRMDVGVGIVDVKNYYVETADDIEQRIRACLRYVPADRLSVSPDCGLSQTARWASFAKLSALVQGAVRVRATL